MLPVIIVGLKLRPPPSTLAFKHLTLTVLLNLISIWQNPIAVNPPTGTSSSNLTYEVEDFDMPLPSLTTEWEIKPEQVKIIKVIGKGAFSRVAKATALNIRGNQEDTTVAVKMLKGRRVCEILFILAG